MAHNELMRRVGALEGRALAGLRKWHRILCFEYQTQAEAITAYENSNGPIGPDDGSILRVIISKPGPSPRED